MGSGMYLLKKVKTLMTRIGEDCKMIIQGDMSQCDKYKTNGVSNYEKSTFYDVWFRLKGESRSGITWSLVGKIV